MKLWVCHQCGYITKSEIKPVKCEGCGQENPRITENWASVHKLGSVGENGPQNVIDAVWEDADTDSHDAAKYMAASRAAYREGYPEIGSLLKEFAYLKIEQAGKGLELLGENVSSSTEENLRDIYNELVKSSAKRSGTSKMLLAIRGYHGEHELVHENARDDARFGEAILGLLKRFF